MARQRRTTILDDLVAADGQRTTRRPPARPHRPRLQGGILMAEYYSSGFLISNWDPS